jgi:hypothetical protein
VATEQGVAIPAFSSSLSYYDGYRRERGPANLIQGLRDFFGAHTYQRTDGEGYSHTRWAQDGTEAPMGGRAAAQRGQRLDLHAGGGRGGEDGRPGHGSTGGVAALLLRDGMS